MLIDTLLDPVAPPGAAAGLERAGFGCARVSETVRDPFLVLALASAGDPHDLPRHRCGHRVRAEPGHADDPERMTAVAGEVADGFLHGPLTSIESCRAAGVLRDTDGAELLSGSATVEVPDGRR